MKTLIIIAAIIYGAAGVIEYIVPTMSAGVQCADVCKCEKMSDCTISETMCHPRKGDNTWLNCCDWCRTQ
jgi:hypothetical protein